MTEKEKFIEEMKRRTRKFAVDIIAFCDTLKNKKASSVIIYQLVKAGTSTGANYRAACRARSSNEFFSKMSIVVEELDESEFWLLVIKEADLSNDKEEQERLLIEANELLKILSKSRSTSSKYRKK